jgi:hypothetical protein
MLIGKKCDFKSGEVEYTGIIVEKYRGSDHRDYYIVDTGEKLTHLPCVSLRKIYDESVIDKDDIFDKAVKYVQEYYCDVHLSNPSLLLGNVAELIEITTGKKVDWNVLAKYSK